MYEVYKSAEGYFVARSNPFSTIGDLLKHRVSPFFETQDEAYGWFGKPGYPALAPAAIKKP